MAPVHCVDHVRGNVCAVWHGVVRAIAGGAAFVFAQRRRKAYELQVALGEWHEGVIVFPSGDLVGALHAGLWARPLVFSFVAGAVLGTCVCGGGAVGAMTPLATTPCCVDTGCALSRGVFQCGLHH